MSKKFGEKKGFEKPGKFKENERDSGVYRHGKSDEKTSSHSKPEKGRKYSTDKFDRKPEFERKKTDYKDRPERSRKPENKPDRPSGERKSYQKSFEPKPKKDWQRDDLGRSEEGSTDQLILKGRHEVVQALESGQTIDSVVISTAVKGPVGKIVRELASKSQIPVKEMNPDLFERKFGEKSQGIVAVCGAFSYSTLESLSEVGARGNGILVALNHVEDARNLGAIVRTVEASGCSGVLIPKHRSAGMTEWAVRTAQGAASYLPVARVNNMGDALDQLKADGYWIVGLDGDSEKTYDQVVYSGKIVLVAGGEDAGLGERVRKVCDDVVAIPLNGKTPSLNVSVSTAVVLYEIIRQKHFFKKN